MPSPTVAELQGELDRMRNIIGQCRQLGIETAELLLQNEVLKNEALQNKTLVNTLLLRIEEMERDKLLRSPLSTPNSPIPAHNLQPALNSVAQMDGAIVQTLIDNSHASFETRITNLLTQHRQKHTTGPISAPTPFGATVSSGLPGPLQSPSNPIFNVSGGAPSTTKGTPNEYDKAVEVEHCKLCKPVLTNAAIRAWKLAFDVYTTAPNRRMTMYEALGTQSMRSLIIMFSAEPILTTMDDAHSNLNLHGIFLKSNLFSEIQLAVITTAIKQETPLTVEPLQPYLLAGFHASIYPLSEEIAFGTTNQDIYKTLIQAFYDG